MKLVWIALFTTAVGIFGCSTAPQETVQPEVALPMKTVQSEVALPIAQKNNCLACHGIDQRSIGPSFKDVAKRYRGQDVQQQLFRKVRNGSSGVWGVIPAPPSVQISEENLKLLIRWITEMEPSADSKSKTVVETSVNPGQCAVTVTQAGQEIASKSNGRARIFEIQSAPFRIEVSSARCKPSIGTFRNVGDFRYVAASPVVISDPMFSMAGSEETRDILHFRSENPRLIEGYEGIYDSYKKEYESICKANVTCPLKIRAYRNYWSFVGDTGGVASVYAEFKRLTFQKPLQGVRGDMPLIVYTKNRDFLDAQGHLYLQAMETHPLILRFK